MWFVVINANNEFALSTLKTTWCMFMGGNHVINANNEFALSTLKTTWCMFMGGNHTLVSTVVSPG